jgi:hypothetical protein
MKRVCLFVAINLMVGAALAQEQGDNLAQLRIRVTDEDGVPVSRAEVALSTFINWVPGRRDAGRDEYNTVVGSTDTNGMTVLNLKSSTGRFGCMVLPLPGFQFDKGTEYVFTNAVAGRWEPWAPLVPLLLKRQSFNRAPPAKASAKEADQAPGMSKDPHVGRQDLFPQDRR